MQRVVAILVGFLLGFVIPGVVLGALLFMVEVRQPDGTGEVPLWFDQVPLFFLAAMPVIAGFITAHIGRVQPLINGLLVGALGGLVLLLVPQPIPLLNVAILLLEALGGLFGAWLRGKLGGDASHAL